MAASEGEFALAQFQSLRAEILQLINMQSQLIGVNVVALGALLSIAVQGEKAPIILIYPLISLFLGMSWLNHAHSICRTSEFVASKIEPHYFSEDAGWETYLRQLPPNRFGKLGYWGVRSIFPGGSVLAIVAALLVGINSPFAWIAFAISSTITIVTLVTFAIYREDSHGIIVPPNIEGS
jgi:hypothetical protein